MYPPRSVPAARPAHGRAQGFQSADKVDTLCLPFPTRVGMNLEPKYSAYNMAHEGSAGYTKRLTYDAKENGVISVPSGHSAGEISPALYGFPNLIMRDDAVLDVSNIPPVCEVVNIRFAERV